MVASYTRQRLEFPQGKQKYFLVRVLKRSHLKVEDLAGLVNVCPRTIRDWRKEKFCMTECAADFLSRKFRVKLLISKKHAAERWNKKKLDISKKGGIAYYKKYGAPGTPISRSTTGKKTLQILRERGIIPPVKVFKFPHYSKYLAEWVGILLGDGCITANQVQITLNATADKDYVSYVKNLSFKLFGEEPKSYNRVNQNAIVLYISGVRLIKYFLKIGLRTGNKVIQQVEVPSWILSNPEYSKCCMRGLLDTDGGIFIHRYKVNGKLYSYKKICFTNRCLPILYFVARTFKDLGFTPKIVDKVENKKVWLYNSTEVLKYLESVGSHNRRLFRYK